MVRALPRACFHSPGCGEHFPFHCQSIDSLACPGSMSMLQARLIEERWHPPSANALYDLSRPLEDPSSASTESHATTGACGPALLSMTRHVALVLSCCSGCSGRATYVVRLHVTAHVIKRTCRACKSLWQPGIRSIGVVAIFKGTDEQWQRSHSSRTCTCHELGIARL